jgi:hypothetical protein
VAAGDDHPEERRLRRILEQPDGEQVALQVVRPDEGLSGGEAQRLGHLHTHQQGANEARAGGDGDEVHIVHRLPRPREGLVEDGEHLHQVVAAGQLRHHPTPAPVDVHLGGDDIGEHAPAVLHEGGGGLITRGFESQYEQGSLSGSPPPAYCPSCLSAARTSLA